MKNLNPLNITMQYWDDIVNCKNLDTRTNLLAIRDQVDTRYNQYTTRRTPNRLETIGASIFSHTDSVNLLGCYSKSKNLTKLKVDIKNAQLDILKAECQYCNISEPTTFDHYAPKELFPEFSVLSINLLPCCPKCNLDKGTDWLLPNGKRKIINFYYDKLPNIQFLNCTINYTGGVPKVNFSVNDNVIPAEMRDTIVNHFNSLKLIDRYKEKSNSEITDVFNSIQPLSGILSRSEVQNHLRSESLLMKNDRGTNYWRAILKHELSSNNQFLTDAGY